MKYRLIKFLHEKPVIALVGASNDRRKYGNVILRDLRRKRFQVIPVNRNGGQVENATAYRTLAEAKQAMPEISLVVLVVPPASGLSVAREAAELGLKKIWMQPGASDKPLETFLKEHDFEYLTDHCVMVESN